MNNEITINIDKIKNASDESITDAETIRQIALYSIKNNDIKILKKINPLYHFQGLYPFVQKSYNIVPDKLKHK